MSFGLSDRPLGSGDAFEPMAQGDVAIHARIQPQAAISDTTTVEVSPSPEAIYVPVVDRHSVPLLTAIIDFENATFVIEVGFDFIAAARQKGRWLGATAVIDSY